MIVKVFKAVWFLSLVGSLAIFLYSYASLPESILLGDGPGGVELSRNALFYSTLALMAVLNALVFVISRLFAASDEFFRAWFYGLVSFLNLFIGVSIQFVSVYNSQERFDYGRIGFIIYGSIGLVVVWTFVWPIYALAQRIMNKQAV